MGGGLKGDEWEIYSEVDGVYSSERGVGGKGKKVDGIWFEEMVEMG